MTKREARVIAAFLNCIAHGEYSEDYAITLIEDNARFGWLSDGAKEAFYAALEPEEEAPAEGGEEAPVDEPEGTEAE